MGLIPYVKTVWKSGKTGGTAWTPTRLNNIENGIENVVTEVNDKETRIKTLEGLKYAGSSSAGGAATSALVCTGNASTATKLATTRTIKIGNQSNTFDGSANITFTAADTNLAPQGHASTATTYGIGTTANYGHVKTINGVTQSSHADGTALSAYQGYVLQNSKLQSITITTNSTVTIVGEATQSSYATSNATYHTRFKDLILLNTVTHPGYGAMTPIYVACGTNGSSSAAASSYCTYAIYNGGGYTGPGTFVSGTYSNGKLTLKITLTMSYGEVSFYTITYNPRLTSITVA